MRRRIPMIAVAVLIAAAFAGGYLLRSADVVADLVPGGGQALAQSPSPAPSPPASPRGGQRDRVDRDRGLVVGTVESVRDRTLVVKVTSARGVKVDQGATFTAQVEADASVLREIPLAELRRGNTVTLRGTVQDGKLVVRNIIVELR